MKQKTNNSYPLRHHNYKNIPLVNIPNYSDISRNSNQKITTVEKNLNDLNLDTETELSKGGSDLSFVLDGLKKEIDEISQNIIETDKKVIKFTKKNIENSKKLKGKSFNNLYFPIKKEDNKSGIHFYSPEKYFKYKIPPKLNKLNNVNYNY